MKSKIFMYVPIKFIRQTNNNFNICFFIVANYFSQIHFYCYLNDLITEYIIIIYCCICIEIKINENMFS